VSAACCSAREPDSSLGRDVKLSIVTAATVWCLESGYPLYQLPQVSLVPSIVTSATGRFGAIHRNSCHRSVWCLEHEQPWLGMCQVSGSCRVSKYPPWV